MNDKHLITSVLWQFVIAAAIGCFVMYIFEANLVDSMKIGAVIWIALIFLFAGKIASLWFIWPKANYAFVLENGTAAVERVTRNNLAHLHHTNTLRVVYGPTITGKSPFENILGGKAIDLKRSIPISATVQVKVKDGNVTKLKWWTPLSVIQADEAIINFARHTEEQLVGQCVKNFSSHLQSICAKYENLDLLYADIEPSTEPQGDGKRVLGPLQKKFMALYGGSGVVTDYEISIGVQTGDPVVEIELDEDMVNASRSAIIAGQKAKAIKAYTDLKVNPNAALNQVAIDGHSDQLPADVMVYGLPEGTVINGLFLDGRSKNKKD